MHLAGNPARFPDQGLFLVVSCLLLLRLLPWGLRKLLLLAAAVRPARAAAWSCSPPPRPCRPARWFRIGLVLGLCGCLLLLLLVAAAVLLLLQQFLVSSCLRVLLLVARVLLLVALASLCFLGAVSWLRLLPCASLGPLLASRVLLVRRVGLSLLARASCWELLWPVLGFPCVPLCSWLLLGSSWVLLGSLWLLLRLPCVLPLLPQVLVGILVSAWWAPAVPLAVLEPSLVLLAFFGSSPVCFLVPSPCWEWSFLVLCAVVDCCPGPQHLLLPRVDPTAPGQLLGRCWWLPGHFPRAPETTGLPCCEKHFPCHCLQL